MQVMLIPAVSAPSRIRRLPSVRVGLLCGPLCSSSLVCPISPLSSHTQRDRDAASTTQRAVLRYALQRRQLGARCPCGSALKVQRLRAL
jgi:hypothetical protein